MKLKSSIKFSDGEVFPTEHGLTLTLTKLPISNLTSMLSPQERKQEIDDNFVQGLANSLLTCSNQITPILVTPVSKENNNYYLIIDGENRVQALKNNSINEVLAVVIEGITHNMARVYRLFTRRHKFNNPQMVVQEIQNLLHLTSDFSIHELETLLGINEGDYFLYDKLQTTLKYQDIFRDLMSGKITTNTAIQQIKEQDKKQKRQENKENKIKKFKPFKNAKSEFLENELEGKGLPKAFNDNFKHQYLLKRDKECFCCGATQDETTLVPQQIVPSDAKGQFNRDNVISVCLECKTKINGYALDSNLNRELTVKTQDLIDNTYQNIMIIASIITNSRLNNLKALEKMDKVLYNQVITGAKSYLSIVHRLKNVEPVLPSNVTPYEYIKQHHFE